MHLILGQFYDVHTIKAIETFCMGEVLVPQVRLQAGLFQRAVLELVQEYAVLRAAFTYGDGLWLMSISSAKQADKSFVVQQAAKEAFALQQQLQMAVDDFREHLDLQTPPLFRYVLFDAEHASHQRLLLIFHHLICDGISSRLLWKRLSAIYHQLLRGTWSGGVPLSDSYPHFHAEVCGRHRALAWQPGGGALRVQHAGELNQLFQRTGLTSSWLDAIQMYQKIMGKDVVQLRKHAAHFGVSLSDFFLTCWLRTLAQFQNDGQVFLLLWTSPHFVGHWQTSIVNLVGSVSFPIPVAFSLHQEEPLPEALVRVGQELDRGLSSAEDFAVRHLVGEPGTHWPELPTMGFNFVSDYRPGQHLIAYEKAPENVYITPMEQECLDLGLGLDVEVYGEEIRIHMHASPLVDKHLSADVLMTTFFSLLTEHQDHEFQAQVAVQNYADV